MLLWADGLSKSYDGVRVLSDVQFDLRPGEVHALVGENGAGKSTFLKIISGAVAADAGELRVAGVRPSAFTPAAMRAAGLAVVYQELSLVSGLTVAENIFLGREAGSWWLDRRTMLLAAQRVLDQLGVAVDPKAVVGKLSVAQQQLIEIARAVAADARILVLDEPTATLSAVEVESLFQVLAGMRSRGMGIVYVSHRLDEVFAIADRVTVFRDGSKVASAPVSVTTPDRLVSWMVGRSVSHVYPVREPVDGPVVLEIERMEARPRFLDVSLSLRAGEVVGLAGLVGAGRTSLGLAIAGALPWRGMMRVDGAAARFLSPRAAIAAGVVYVTEDRKGAGIVPRMSVEDNMTLTHVSTFRRRGLLSRRRARGWAAAIASQVDLRAARLDLPVRALSGGNQQKALIARFLVRCPRVLILDEPTRGVDVGAREEIYRIIDGLARAGTAILVISSDLPEVIGLADRVVVMKAGRSVGELSRAAASPEAVMALATGVAA